MNIWKSQIEALGGILKTNELDEIDLRNIQDAKTIFRKLRNHLLKEELIDSLSDIELLILASNKIAAFPLKTDRNISICISIGLIRAIWNVLLLSLCDNKIFPDYGAERGTYKVRRRLSHDLIFGPSIIPAKNSQQFIGRKELNKYQDITQSRKELCETLFNNILDYLFYHEAMHFTRDHLTFIHIYNNRDYIDEVEISRRNIKFFQFLEIDADLSALNFMLPTNPEIPNFKKLKNYRQEDFIFGQMFSNLIVQQLFDFSLNSKNLRKQWRKDHPPPVIRSILYDNLLHQYFLQQKILSKEVIRDQQNKAWWEASHIALKLGFPLGRWHGKTLDGINFKRINKLIGDFNSFQNVMERSHGTGSYKEIKKIIKLL